MRTIFTALVVVVLFVSVLGVTVVVYIKTTGLSARPTPGALEARVAHAFRSLAIPADVRRRTNPVAPTEEALAGGRAHFARSCAICHANDGGGDVTIGRGLFPKAPDMRATETQTLTDGELFYIIEYGVRFAGMPAWGDGSAKGEELAWRLVHFIRRLPRLSEDEIAEMEELNPKSP